MLKCPRRPLGPSMKRLVAHHMAAIAVPAGTGEPLRHAMAALVDRVRFTETVCRALSAAVDAVAAVRGARGFADLGLPDDSDETIAGELVRRVEERILENARRLVRHP